MSPHLEVAGTESGPQQPGSRADTPNLYHTLSSRLRRRLRGQPRYGLQHLCEHFQMWLEGEDDPIWVALTKQIILYIGLKSASDNFPTGQSSVPCGHPEPI